MKKRPKSMTIVALVWITGSIYNICRGLILIAGYLGAAPLLSYPNIPDWLRFVGPMEMLISFILVIAAFFSLYTVYGLLVAKPWSYHAAIVSSILVMVIYIAFTLLYLSISPTMARQVDFPLDLNIGVALASAVINVFWAVGVWDYLTKTEVKAYLNQLPTPVAPTLSTLPISSPPEVVASTDEMKFCRYCGGGNKIDAVFCEKCGKRIA